MIKSVSNPVEERNGGEEVIGLTELVKLGVPVKHPSAYKLIENTNDERGQDGEDDVEI
jgi:hypothetical protein